METEDRIMNAITLLASNPKLFFKLLVGKIKIKVTRQLLKSPILKKINGILFEFDFNYDPAIKRMYFGIYELETVEVMRKVLKTGDTFLDVGANVGYLTAIGGLVGKTGQVHSFEPVPEYFQRLKKIAMMNRDYKIVVNQCALGEERGTAKIDVTNLPNIGWNTMVPGFMSNATRKKSTEVPVYRLDSYIKEKGLDKISLIKIDVEGFEFPVLKGLQNYFESTGHRPVILCEIAPSAYPLLGKTVAQLSNYMKKYSYRTFSLINTNAAIDITRLKEYKNEFFRKLKGETK